MDGLCRRDGITVVLELYEAVSFCRFQRIDKSEPCGPQTRVAVKTILTGDSWLHQAAWHQRDSRLECGL